MDENNKIAQLLFPNVTKTIEKLEEQYPIRNLPKDAAVTRFAPSPTGFVHIGSIMTSLASERLAKQSKGIFILRIEDTDKTRELEGGVDEIANARRSYDIKIDEGVISSREQTGPYGPYIQSERIDIYAICAKYLVAQGYAYPCFCSSDALETIRKEQEALKVKPGYYGTWAKDRTLSYEEIKTYIDAGKSFAIRIKAQAKENEKIILHDLIHGDITMPANDQDYILLKSDGLATYHFAHVIDDHFMRVTHILRGDEWLPSAPVHIQLFTYFQWDVPHFAHIAPIQKIDGTSKRKLSKRKDPEANVAYYLQTGFPTLAVTEYLLNLINSNFEDWRKVNPDSSYTEFCIRIAKMNKSGALFDIVKLEDISKQVIGRFTSQEIYNQVYIWASLFDPEFANLLEQDHAYSLNILSIEQDQKGKRKDIAMWAQMRSNIGYFYDLEFNKLTTSGYAIPENVNIYDMIVTYKEYLEKLSSINLDKHVWFDEIRKITEKLGYTANTKEYRKSPTQFKGYVGDIAMFLRIALTNRANTPDLQEIMKVMGEERVKERLEKAISILKSKPLV